jgi:hypothetical protein
MHSYLNGHENSFLDHLFAQIRDDLEVMEQSLIRHRRSSNYHLIDEEIRYGTSFVSFVYWFLHYRDFLHSVHALMTLSLDVIDHDEINALICRVFPSSYVFDNQENIPPVMDRGKVMSFLFHMIWLFCFQIPH